MADARLDALVLCAPHAVRYATRGDPGVAALFGRAGAAFALVPADPGLTLAAVVGDTQEAAFRAASGLHDVRTHPLWIETARLGGADTDDIAARIETGWGARPPGFARPATCDLTLAAAALRELLAARGLVAGRLGLDLGFVPAADFAALQALLAPAVLSDASPLLDRLMAVKHPEEIARLRLGAELSVAGLAAMAAAARAGDAAADLSRAFRSGVADAAAGRGVPVPASWDYIAVGERPWSGTGRIAAGAVIKADVGCVIDGYSSDTSRDFVWREATPALRRLHALIEHAFAAGLAALRPGAALADIHAATTRALRDGGLTRFSRGHFGHGLGAGPFSEVWPFVAADSEAVAEPGMVLAFEVPLYVDGLGGFNLEDQFLVTDTGVEAMSIAPRGLTVLG
jgi:Xaa-Pro aminopeptidase